MDELGNTVRRILQYPHAYQVGDALDGGEGGPGGGRNIFCHLVCVTFLIIARTFRKHRYNVTHLVWVSGERQRPIVQDQVQFPVGVLQLPEHGDM